MLQMVVVVVVVVVGEEGEEVEGGVVEGRVGVTRP